MKQLRLSLLLLVIVCVDKSLACFAATGPRPPKPFVKPAPKSQTAGDEFVDDYEDYIYEDEYEDEYEEPEKEESKEYDYERPRPNRHSNRKQVEDDRNDYANYEDYAVNIPKTNAQNRGSGRNNNHNNNNNNNNRPSSSSLGWLPDVGPNPTVQVKPRPKTNPKPKSRNAQQQAAESGSALDVVLASLTAGDISIIPIETLNSIPPSTLAKLPPEVLSTLPPEILAKLSVDSHIKATALGETIRFLPVDKVVALPWNTVIKGLPSDAINSFSPTVLGAIPWTDVLSDVPPDTMGGLALSTLQVVPPTAWQRITFESLQSIKPNVLASLPLSSLRNIPPGHLKKLGPEILSAFSKDVLAAINPELLNQAVSQGTQFKADTVAAAQGLAAGTIGRLGRRNLGLSRSR